MERIIWISDIHYLCLNSFKNRPEDLSKYINSRKRYIASFLEFVKVELRIS
jgi:hypothetical protein